ncbi:hypothetical protein K6119_06270 [Paracrocinitomix mangrovi]|uniref:hypothetical protein n=1 Tax=Paracrocinitomix mangrovi TaxID=2862509 RepID=UPI001C8D6610|nr:hypothetical protein [Paracrocinitomix mangrovi]UKN03117.1 hypothetical protein K6119_06270 [Paracrocinitomix mangrovi]
MNKWLLTYFLFFSLGLFAQNDTINQTDENGLKQGYWIIYGHMKPEKEYSAEGIIEEGTYKDDRKQGVWTKYFQDGKTIRLIGTYEKNRPNGEYWKFYESGCLKEHGVFRTYKMESNHEAHSEIDKKHQLIEIYKDDCDTGVSNKGTLIPPPKNISNLAYGDTLMYKFSNDSIELICFWEDSIKVAYRYNECQELIEKISWDSNLVSKVEKFKISEDCFNKIYPPGEGGPTGKFGIRKDKKPFEPDDYNKLYNDKDEIWMDGIFKNGKLWSGKLYKFDSDGILLKIEIWKNGKYHSDGDL